MLLTKLCQGCAVIVVIIAGGKAGDRLSVVEIISILIAVLVTVIILVVIVVATAIYINRRCNRGMYTVSWVCI